MARQVQELTVLIASPGDVAQQRDVIQREIEDWNRRAHGDVRLTAMRWELDAVPELGVGDGQEVINKQLRDRADIVIGIFHSRLGTATARAASGTAEEIEGAAGRGVPVHVYIDVRPIPRDHDPEQFSNLKSYVAHLKTKGLLREVGSDEELARDVRLALARDVEMFLRRLSQTSAAPVAAAIESPPLVRWRDQLDRAADAVFSTEALAPDAEVNGVAEWVQEAFVHRRAELLTTVEPLLRLVVEAVRVDDVAVDDAWIELIPQLAANPFASGSTALLELKRAPGALLFHMGGLAACAVRNDALTGRLLSSRIMVDDPYKGRRPAVLSLRADLAFPTGNASKALHDHLVPILATVVGDRVAKNAWQRWTYLCAVATTFLSVTHGGGVEHPYLMVSGHHNSPLSVELAGSIRSSVAERGAEHPLLLGGLCDGNPTLFEEAATTFESNYGQWADRADWETLPAGGGMLPSRPHFPGEG